MRSVLVTTMEVVLVFGAVLAVATWGEEAKNPEPPAKVALNFDDIKDGRLPPGWKVDATDSKGDLAEWKVVADGKAPSKPNVLVITKITDTSRGVFNLCWTPEVKFKDGSVSVKARGNTGDIDQGGGLIWRARDVKNYYVCRYNPLETNCRLYFVKDGVRVQLADAKGLQVPAGQWFTLKVIHKGDKIECWLDGKKVIEATDATFPDAGGVGLWTKADAASSFDDFEVAAE